MKKIVMFLILACLVFPYQSLSAKASSKSPSISEMRKDPNYTIIYKGLLSYKSSVKIKYNRDTSKIWNVFNTVLNDHPEIFYVKDNKTILYSNGFLKLGYDASISNIKSRVAKLNKKVISIQKGVNAKWSTVQKVKYLHDYIVDHTQYDVDNLQNGTLTDNDFNAYGALLNRKSVCQGYASAMVLLLNKQQIPNYMVTGQANNGYSTESHAWNLILIQGKYYHLDTTWDDPITSNGKPVKRYDYFLLNDSSMRKDHQWNTSQYPKASGNAYDNMRAKLRD